MLCYIYINGICNMDIYIPFESRAKLHWKLNSAHFDKAIFWHFIQKPWMEISKAIYVSYLDLVLGSYEFSVMSLEVYQLYMKMSLYTSVQSSSWNCMNIVLYISIVRNLLIIVLYNYFMYAYVHNVNVNLQGLEMNVHSTHKEKRAFLKQQKTHIYI